MDAKEDMESSESLKKIDVPVPEQVQRAALSRLIKVLGAPLSQLGLGAVLIGAVSLFDELLLPGGCPVVDALRAALCAQVVDRELEVAHLRTIKAGPWSLIGRAEMLEHPTVRKYVATELLLGLLTERVFRPQAVKNVRKFQGMSSKEQQLEAIRLQNYMEPMRAEIYGYVLAGETHADLAQRGLNAALLASMAGQLDPNNLQDRLGVDTDRLASDQELLHVCEQFPAKVREGDARASLGMLLTLAPVPLHLLLRVPIAGPSTDGYVVTLDLESGVIRADLTRLLKLPKAGAAGHIPAQAILRNPLPQLLLTTLQAFERNHGVAKNVGELLGLNGVHDKEHVAPSAGSRLTYGRFWRSRLVLALSAGLTRSAAITTCGALAGLTAVKQAYTAVAASEQTHNSAQLFGCLNWGNVATQAGDASPVAIGSPMIAGSEVIRTAHQKLVHTAESLRVGKKYTAQGLVAFHNAYALAVASALAFFFLGRRAAVMKFRADLVNPAMPLAYLCDKAVGPWKGATPLPVSELAAEQLRLWNTHLIALHRRLKKLDVGQQEVLDRIGQVTAANECSLLFALELDVHGQVRLLEFGMRHLTSDDDALEMDTAGRRDFIANSLRARAVSSQAIEMVLRHFSDGISPWQEGSTVSAIRLRETLSIAIDEIASEIGVVPVAGISRG